MLRGGFERDVAMSLVSDVTNARDRVFSVSNLCGRLERFGRMSPCCGALTSLLNATSVMETVRHPWFEQLNHEDAQQVLGLLLSRK